MATRPRAAEDISAVRRSMHPADCIPAGGKALAVQIVKAPGRLPHVRTTSRRPIRRVFDHQLEKSLRGGAPGSVVLGRICLGVD